VNEELNMKTDFTFTLGHILSIIAMVSAVIIFVVSLTFLSSSNRDDIRELKESVKEVQMSINNLQTVVHSIDRRTAVLEERTGRNTVLGF
jgi:cell division protein FtsL